MKITKDEVKHVAHLARLSLSEGELEEMTGQLDTILTYMDKLNELDTHLIKPTTHVFSINNAFREDEVQESLSQADAVKNGPQHEDGFFQVPRVI